MNNGYDYEIVTEKLNPPLGENHYAAKVQMMVKFLGTGQTERINPNIGEMWGKTQQEAYQKVHRAVEDWIAAHK